MLFQKYNRTDSDDLVREIEMMVDELKDRLDTAVNERDELQDANTLLTGDRDRLQEELNEAREAKGA